MDAIKNIILNTKEEELENILSPFIKEQFPTFIQTDYPKLILFIKAYYEWCDKAGNASYVMSNLDTAFDIDRNLDEFLTHFENTYISALPAALATNTSGNKPNRKTILKKIRDFYGNKGTESAYKFLFRVLYDSDLELYYPKADILKSSDGQWIEPRSIKTTSINGSALFAAKRGRIVQFSGSEIVSSAFIESVVQYSFNGLPVTEFFVTDISGEPFKPGIPVRIIEGTSEWTETAYSVLGEFFVEIPGEQYRIGDRVSVIDPNGIGFSAKVEQVSLAGGIKKIGIINSGLNYGSDVVLQIFSDTNPGTRAAKVVALRSAVTKYPGYFSGNRGKLSSTKKIPDGHYYQDFSYELKSEISLSTYFETLKKLIHPSGTRMFGSVLVKKALTNQVESVSQSTVYGVPLIGKYTPYTSGTTYNLRNNGVTLAGYWLGNTGDLYPLGYNPFIGSTTQVGPNGTTTPNGTIFVGSSLGYTWCYVPENGRTAHNPIGSPLGSTLSWRSGRETGFEPNHLEGLVLWLKPENIGVCGSVVNGASADVWTDASPSANHALPPTWNRWNGVADITKTFTSAVNWNRSVYSTNPVTKISFVANGVCGGYTTGRLFMMGMSEVPTVHAGYTAGIFVYSIGRHNVGSSSTDIPTYVRRFVLYATDANNAVYRGNGAEIIRANILTGTTNHSNQSGLDNTVIEMEYAAPDFIVRADGVEKQRIFVGYNKTYYIDSSFFLGSPDTSNPASVRTSVTLLETSYNGTPVVPALQASHASSFNTIVYSGVTIDKLRPTLQTAGFGGATGVSFNGGVLFAPTSTYAGVSLASSVLLGFTAAGSSAEKLLNGQHLYLTKPLRVTDDADIFVVYKSTLDGVSYGYGILGSRNTNIAYANNLRFDSVLFNRSYNLQDRTPSLQNSSSYTVLPNGTLLYPGASLPPAGLAGFRPQGDAAGALQNFIAYDPHVSGVCMGICVAEATRDANNKIETFLNGDRGLNESRITGNKIVSVSAPSTEGYVINKNLVYEFDAGNNASVGEFRTSQATNLLQPYPFTETPINILNPVDPANFRGDGGISTVTRVTQDGGPNLGTDEVYEFTTGTSGNIYIGAFGTNLAAPVIAAGMPSVSTTWTFSAVVRRDDGAAITSAGVYIYAFGATSSQTGTVESLGDGWYKITLVRTGTPASAVSLVGLTFFPDAGVKYRIGRLQLLPYDANTDISGTGTRVSANYPSGYQLSGTVAANEIGYRTGPWGQSQIVWEGKNHSTIRTTASFNDNGGFRGTPAVSIDRTKTYRFSVWINRAILGTGTVYFGPQAAVLRRSTGTTDSNPYFTANTEADSVYSGNENKWVLAVAHIHPQGSGSGANHPDSGFYLPNSGTTFAPLSVGDFVWDSTATSSGMRAFLYGSTVPGSRVWFTHPRIEVVDSTEISVQDLTTNTANSVYDLSTSGSVSEARNHPQFTTEGGGSLLFSGNAAVVTTNTNVSIGTGGSNTWEAWVRRTDTAQTTGGHSMYMGAGGLPYFSANTSNGYFYWSFSTALYGQKGVTSKTPIPFTQNRWTHVVCVSDYNATENKTTYSMYIDGVFNNSVVWDGKQNIEPTVQMTIGNRSPGTRYIQSGHDYAYSGYVSNVRVYSRALNLAEIQQNFNSLRNRFGI